MHRLPPPTSSQYPSWRSWSVNRPYAMHGPRRNTDAFRDYKKAIALLDSHRVKTTPPFRVMLVLAFSLHLFVVTVWSVMTHRLLDEMPISYVEIRLGDMEAEDLGGIGLGGENPGEMAVADQPVAPVEARAIPVKTSPQRRSAPRAQTRQPAWKAPVEEVDSFLEAPAPAEATRDGARQAPQQPPASLRENAEGAGYLLGDQSGGAAAGQGNLYGNVTLPAATIKARYEQKLSAWLERFRIYPRQARQAGQQGQVIVRVRIDRDGRVLGKWIEQGSGFPALDNAVLEQVGRADPFPAAPADYSSQSQLEFRFPVTLSITG